MKPKVEVINQAIADRLYRWVAYLELIPFNNLSHPTNNKVVSRAVHIKADIPDATEDVTMESVKGIMYQEGYIIPTKGKGIRIKG